MFLRIFTFLALLATVKPWAHNGVREHTSKGSRQLIRALDSCGLLNRTNGLKFLEIGASFENGLFLQKELGVEYTALNCEEDKDEKSIVHISEKFHTVKMPCGSNSTIPLTDNSFDIIYTSNIFEHVSNVPDTANQMYRLLRPGGTIINHWTTTWSSPAGHHIHSGMLEDWEKQFGEKTDSLKKLEFILPYWSHLYLTQQEMKDMVVREKIVSNHQVAHMVSHFIYENDSPHGLNKLFIEDLLAIFRRYKWQHIHRMKCAPFMVESSYFVEYAGVLDILHRKYGPHRNFNVNFCEMIVTK